MTVTYVGNPTGHDPHLGQGTPPALEGLAAAVSGAVSGVLAPGGAPPVTWAGAAASSAQAASQALNEAGDELRRAVDQAAAALRTYARGIQEVLERESELLDAAQRMPDVAGLTLDEPFAWCRRIRESLAGEVIRALGPPRVGSLWSAELDAFRSPVAYANAGAAWVNRSSSADTMWRYSSWQAQRGSPGAIEGGFLADELGTPGRYSRVLSTPLEELPGVSRALTRAPTVVKKLPVLGTALSVGAGAWDIAHGAPVAPVVTKTGVGLVAGSLTTTGVTTFAAVALAGSCGTLAPVIIGIGVGIVVVAGTGWAIDHFYESQVGKDVSHAVTQSGKALKSAGGTAVKGGKAVVKGGGKAITGGKNLVKKGWGILH